jgi:hypothetical protein
VEEMLLGSYQYKYSQKVWVSPQRTICQLQMQEMIRQYIHVLKERNQKLGYDAGSLRFNHAVRSHIKQDARLWI